MNITAARVGSTPIRWDWSALEARLGADFGARSEKAWKSLSARFESGEVAFFNAPESPTHDSISQIQASEALAREVLARGTLKDVLILGIGGSALGPLVIHHALQDRHQGGLQFHFLENPDPMEWRSTLARLSPESTLVVVITKSGTTYETLAQFQCALEWLGPERFKDHIVAITDPKQGDLRAFATEYNIPTLSIDPGMGGRFSVFSPVGLFPMLLMGLDARAFLLGAKQARDGILKSPHEKNPHFVIAQALLAQASRRTVHVFMPYSSRLRSLGLWFTQLWGESLGKDGKGFTPLSACGAIDQHSLLQLLRDGPDDKITWFVTLDSFGTDVTIPKRTRPGSARYGSFEILENHGLGELLAIEQQAIHKVLTRAKRPHLTLGLDRLDERSLGATFFSLCTLTAITGALWDINPFDQPGVEEGKIYIRESLTQSRNDRIQSAIAEENSPVARLRREPSSNSVGEDPNFD